MAETAVFSPTIQLSSSWALIVFPAFLTAGCEDVLYAANGIWGHCCALWPQLFRSWWHSSIHSLPSHGLGSDNNKALRDNSLSRWKNLLSLHHHKEENQLGTSVMFRMHHLNDIIFAIVQLRMHLLPFSCMYAEFPVFYFYPTTVITSKIVLSDLLYITFFTLFLWRSFFLFFPCLLSFQPHFSFIWHITYH